MRRRRRGLRLFAAIALLLALSGGGGAEETFFVFGGQPDESAWGFPIPREILEDAPDVLVLVNRENLLDKGYPPDDELHALVEPTVAKTKNVQMPARAVANDALTAMFEAAKADGVHLLLHSGYRSHYTQAVIYENRLKERGYDDGWQLPGGASEHQTGLAFDVVSKEWIGKSFNNAFAETAEGRWLAANCARFGFIIRYPEGKKDITGVNWESWHVRYVGREVAAYITENRLTLEEFSALRAEALAR